MEVIVLTEQAQLQAANLSRNNEKDGLRIAVTGGGCSGLQYKLGWDDIKEDDTVQEYESGLKILVDPKSALFLMGSTLEFHNDLNQSGFEVVNPNATNTCGCGKSFS